MITDEQIDALKAQVNCLREQLYIIYAAPRSANSFKDLQNYALESLQATPEQCLAEVKAKAIEEYRRQIAESKQIDMATKIMTIAV